jgi:hypothetical protein
MILEEIIGPSVIYFDELPSEKALPTEQKLRMEYEPLSAAVRSRLRQKAFNKFGPPPDGYIQYPDFNDILSEANIKIYNLQSATKKVVSTYLDMSLLTDNFSELLISIAGRKIWNRQNGIKDNGENELKNSELPSSAHEKATLPESN